MIVLVDQQHGQVLIFQDDRSGRGLDLGNALEQQGPVGLFNLRLEQGERPVLAHVLHPRAVRGLVELCPRRCWRLREGREERVLVSELRAGDTVVVDGQDKLKEGSLVDPHQSGGNRNAQSPATTAGTS